MSSQQTHSEPERSLNTLDPVWARIRSDAEHIAAREPSMAGFIFASILNHNRFEDALCHRLAQRLDHPDLHSDLVRQAFEDALEFDEDIGCAARADVVATQDRDPACDRYVEPFLYFKGFHAIQAYRMTHALWNMGRKDFALYLQSRASQVFQADINPAAKIGRGIMVDHATGIVIGATAVVEDDVSMLHEVTLGGTGKETGDRHPKIRRGVLIGAGAKILGNIEIGACSRVASGSVVLQDVPPNRTVAGVPARVVGFAGCEEPARKMDQMVPFDGAGETV